MVHLRVAESLFSRLCGLSETEFTVGNIAPDSGVPNEDWSAFTPPYDVSHFKKENEIGKRVINIDLFASSYFTKEMQNGYTKEQFSFYLGYLTHLMTDILWGKYIVPICSSKDPSLFEKGKKEAMKIWKKDFYDLDALYIRNHPEFRSFTVYDNAKGFVNEYMDIFSRDAIDNRREYIVSFYRENFDDLDREYKYFTMADMDGFVKYAAGKIILELEDYICSESVHV